MLFGDSGPDERPAFVVYELENDSLDGLAAQGGLFVKAADDLAAEHPQMIAMTLKRSGCQALPEQIEQEGREALDDALSGGDVGVFVAPALHDIPVDVKYTSRVVANAVMDANDVGTRITWQDPLKIPDW